jgi:hypothetical protein
MSDKRIMYVCAECAVHSPEGCGHFDRNQLRVMPSGEWSCEGCYDEATTLDRPDWNKLPVPPAYFAVASEGKRGTNV